jgi:threonine dehydrogenase-like Zn-dependent dehydrogenase
MRAVVMRNRKLIVESIPDPEPGPGQVLVETLACGICGSDLHALRFLDRMVEVQRRSGGPFLLDPERDVVMGHEFCAEILDYGPGAQRTLPVGTRVCAMPLAIGADSLATVGYSNDYPGGYGERMVLTEMLLLPVPEQLSTEVAALTEPMAVGLHAVAKAGPLGDDVALVLGCGPVGLAVIAALKLEGAGPIVAADFSPRRRALAEALGADVVVDPAKESPYRRWEEIAVPPGVDPRAILTLLGLGPQPRPGLIFECVGVPGVLQQILEGAPRKARVVVVGVCMETDRVEPAIAINKELSLQFVLGYTPEEFARTLQALADGRISAAPLLTGRVGIDGIPAAFAALVEPEEHAKILAEPWREGELTAFGKPS